MKLIMFMARVFLLSFIGTMTLLSTGCGKKAPETSLSGLWRGSISESGKVHKVELALSSKQGKISGKFRFLSKVGPDIKKGAAFDIVRTEVRENTFKFIVPLSGRVDSDALAVKLNIQGNKLVGTCREMRKGSKPSPIRLTKVK